MKESIRERLHLALRETVDFLTWRGKAVPIVRHLPKDDERREMTDMDRGVHIPGITESYRLKRQRDELEK